MDRRSKKIELAKDEIVRGFQEALAGAADVVGKALCKADSSPAGFSGGIITR